MATTLETLSEINLQKNSHFYAKTHSLTMQPSAHLFS
jgi:hypothetical protein